MENSFAVFGRSHLVAVTVGALITATVIWLGKLPRFQKKVTWLFIGLNLLAYPLSQIAWQIIPQPKSLENYLPFHLCDLSSVVAVVALWSRRPFWCAVIYYLGLASATQALITPALPIDFPQAPFWSFFIHHFAIVGAALYLPVTLGWRPNLKRWHDPLRVYLFAAAYMMVALVVNGLLHTNFGFVSRPPDNPSLIDQLGPWPYYLISMHAITLVLFGFLSLPFWKKTAFTA